MIQASRLTLGTAQFGLHYGITNQRGKIDTNEAKAILEAARDAGISTLDTASAYGDAEELLGALGVSDRFRVVTKIAPGIAANVVGDMAESCQRLKTAKLDTALLHDFGHLQANPEIWERMIEQKRRDLVKHVGVSLYYPTEWDRTLAYCDSQGWPYPDVVQFPLSVFDQRFVPILSRIKSVGTEIFVRSVFLQGVGFSAHETLPRFFESMTPTLHALSAIEERTGLDRAATLLSFPLSFKEVDHVVVGVDAIESFNANITAYSVAAAYAAQTDAVDWSALAVDDESVLIPMNWPARGVS